MEDTSLFQRILVRESDENYGTPTLYCSCCGDIIENKYYSIDDEAICEDCIENFAHYV